MNIAVASKGKRLTLSHVESRRVGRIALAALLALPALLLACRKESTAVPTNDDTIHGAIRAHRFVVVDNAGKERAELGMLDDGRVRLTIRSDTKKSALLIGIDKNAQPVLDFVDANGQVAAQLGAYQDGQLWLMIQDRANNVVARVGVDGAGRALFALEGGNEKPLAELGIVGGDEAMSVFILRDGEGRRRLGMTVTKSSEADIVLNDATGRNRCTVRVDEHGQPQLKLLDDQGNPRANLMVYKEGQCALDLFDSANQQIRVSLVAQATDNGYLSIQDSEGQVIWTAPPSVREPDGE